MHVRFRVALGVRLVAVLGVLVTRYGDPDLSRGEDAGSGWDYRCSKSTCKWAHSYDTKPPAPRCQKCNARMEPVRPSDSGG